MHIAASERDREAFRRFVEGTPGAHFMQGPEWAGVKANWGNEVVLADGPGGRIAGSMSLLIRRVPVFGNVIYCPRGPVCDPNDREALAQLTAGAREVTRRYGAAGVLAEPDVAETDERYLSLMESLGWRRRPCRDVYDTVQPRSLFRVELRGKSEEEVFAGFHSKLRYNIRLAGRRGVEIVEGSRDDLGEFSRLMAVTARRDGFRERPPAYFARLWDALGAGHVSLMLARAGGETCAGGLFVHYGGRTWYGYGASADSHRQDMPCHLLHWEAIRRALRRGDSVYDLRGFLEREDDSCGLYRFKRQFGGELVRLTGELTLSDTPLRYELVREAERAYLRVAPKLIAIQANNNTSLARQ